MNFPGGIGRPVMQHKERLTSASLQDALVNIAPMPSFELFWLVLRQAGLHRKIGFWQVECLLQFEWFGHDHERLEIPILCLHAVLWFRYTAGNIGKQCKNVCYNEWLVVSAAGDAQPFRACANPIGLGIPSEGKLRLNEAGRVAATQIEENGAR